MITNFELLGYKNIDAVFNSIRRKILRYFILWIKEVWAIRNQTHKDYSKTKYKDNKDKVWQQLFIKLCNRNGLIPHFARPKFVFNIKKYLRYKIWRQILDGEIKNKHRKKKRLLQQDKNNIDSLKIILIRKLVLYRKIKVIISKEETK